MERIKIPLLLRRERERCLEGRGACKIDQYTEEYGLRRVVERRVSEACEPVAFFQDVVDFVF